MMWAFGPGMLFLLPLFFLGRFFWIIVLAILIGLLIRRFSRGYRWAPYYHYNAPQQPHAQPSALEILRQRYARGEIDAATFDQMRERLEATGGPEAQR